MAFKKFKVVNYEIRLGYKMSASFNGVDIEAQGLLTCHSVDGYRFVIYGLHPLSDVPEPVYNETSKVGTIFIPFKDLSVYIDLVRNEKPIYASLDSENPAWNTLNTGKEPTGEEEG